jgi:hypothetical protein
MQSAPLKALWCVLRRQEIFSNVRHYIPLAVTMVLSRSRQGRRADDEVSLTSPNLVNSHHTVERCLDRAPGNRGHSHPTGSLFGLRRRETRFSGAETKAPETAPEISLTDCRDKMRARIPANSGLFELNREISGCASSGNSHPTEKSLFGLGGLELLTKRLLPRHE